MSLVEIKDKRDRGLCYNCDKKWSSFHLCQNKFLLLLSAKDDEDAFPIEEHIEVVGDETIVSDISSLHTLSGKHTSRSLQLAGSILGHNLCVLVDRGSTLILFNRQLLIY